MPNTLAHVGVHVPALRAAVPGRELPWILLSCVLPDLPWILQRLLQASPVAVDRYELRLYCIAQSAWIGTLPLCIGLAALSTRPVRVAGLLAAGSLFHLLLDALQTKLANGVHLIAPLSWELLNLAWFWPESVPGVLLTLVGAFVALHCWIRADDPGVRLDLRPRRLGWAAAGLLVYATLPALLLAGPESANNHFVRTLRDTQERPGSPVELDRARARRQRGELWLELWTGEELRAVDASALPEGTVSLRGRFRDARSLVVESHHAHWSAARDWASYVGLAFVAAFWLRSLARGHAVARVGQRPASNA